MDSCCTYQRHQAPHALPPRTTPSLSVSKAATAGESGDETSERGVESMWMSARSMFSTSRSLLSASSTWCFVSAIDASDEGGRPTVSGARLRCFGGADGDGGCSFGSRGTRWLPRTAVEMGVLPLAEPILEPYYRSDV